MIKTFTVFILSILEAYLGPIYGPQTGTELSIITGKLEELTGKIDLLQNQLDLDKQLEEEAAVNKLNILKKAVITLVVIGSILFLFHSFGGDIPGVVGDIGNSVGNQVSTVGNILNKDIYLTILTIPIN
jgi:hypothetical protein